MAAEISERILKSLQVEGLLDTLLLAKSWNEDHQKIVGAVNSLLSLGDVIEAELKSSSQWGLTEEGKSVLESGSHEAHVFDAVPTDGGLLQSQLMATVPNAKIGFSKAMSLGWIALDKTAAGGPTVVRKVASIVDVTRDKLGHLDALGASEKQEFKKRKLVQEITVKSYLLRPGASFSTGVSKQEAELTAEMIATGSWKIKSFKTYNLDALGTPVPRGHLHPLMKVRAEFRHIFLEMGFTEMPTNNFVESSFWNFDSLFQPQQHPARDAHDTFFISDPASTNDIPADYMERVKEIHSHGGHGSVGYGYDWKVEEAQKNLLRTHTTAVSARMLYRLAQDGFRPVKYFSIDRVFRNESLDATHLAEFHQIEGVVADYGLTLGHLIGILYEFFRKLGIEQLRFKPAYNPYTEPSMEVFSYHPGLAKWVEIGNSGIFRPEMLLPMGLPEGVSVIAWGLSLERPTMIKYGVDNIRDLVGPRVNLQMVADNPLCRLDKHSRSAPAEDQAQADELRQLERRMDDLDGRLEALRRNVASLRPRPARLTLVIEADPTRPPTGLRHLTAHLVAPAARTALTVHRHSSLDAAAAAACPADWPPPVDAATPRLDNDVNVAWIWRAGGADFQPRLRFVNRPQCSDLIGQAAIGRLLARLVEASTASLVYESLGAEVASGVDAWLDLVEAAAASDAGVVAVVERLQRRLADSDWAVPGVPTLADVFLAGVVGDAAGVATPSMQRWARRSAAVSSL